MKSNRLFILASSLLALSACGPPAQGDIAYEILSGAKGEVGRQIDLTDTLSLKSLSLSDASQVWLGQGWVPESSQVCKQADLPGTGEIRAFRRDTFGLDPKSNYFYQLRICATQKSNPKAILAIGSIVSREKRQANKVIKFEPASDAKSP